MLPKLNSSYFKQLISKRSLRRCCRGLGSGEAWLRGSSSRSCVQSLPSYRLQLLLLCRESRFQVQLHGCWQETLLHHHAGLSRGFLAMWLPPVTVTWEQKGVCTQGRSGGLGTSLSHAVPSCSVLFIRRQAHVWFVTYSVSLKGGNAWPPARASILVGP